MVYINNCCMVQAMSNQNQQPCPTCDGKGNVHKSYAKIEGSESYFSDTCPDCHGSGKAKGVSEDSKPDEQTNKENDMEPQTSQIEVEPLDLDEKVAAILREDIYATSDGRLMARQPEKYPDDSDSWAEVKSRDDLVYVAQGLIKVVLDWHTPPAESDTPR